jgi:hypothetical protein
VRAPALVLMQVTRWQAQRTESTEENTKPYVTRHRNPRLTMSNPIPKRCMALLKEASEMFGETGCVPGIDGEQVPAQVIVPEAKEYISETIDHPEARYDPALWETPGFALVLSWLAQKWQRRCQILAPRRSKNPAQHLSKEQQKACLDSAAAELIHEITHGGSLN